MFISVSWTEEYIGRTPQGVRGLKYPQATTPTPVERRTPQGVRGLKYVEQTEIKRVVNGRTPQGVRGLKCNQGNGAAGKYSRTPQGVRGLKYHGAVQGLHRGASHPARGAWIEICYSSSTSGASGSHPARGAWIEMPYVPDLRYDGDASHPARGAWIEISAAARPACSGGSRTPQGVRGLKLLQNIAKLKRRCRTPQGVRGLKCCGRSSRRRCNDVAPRKGCVD